jgi:protein SCO1/2
VSFFTKLAAFATATLLWAAPLHAQGLAPEAVDPASAKPGLLGKIGLDQKIGQKIPLDLPFTDDSGRPATLGQYFGKRPVLLVLAYYECPMLCTQVLNGVVSAVGILNFQVGREFDVVVVSFNPKEGPGLAAQKKAAYVERYGRPGSADGWHFLTGTQASIDALTSAVGFRYAYDEKIGQYAHGAGMELLTPSGVLSKYFYGIEFSARDIRLGLIEASNERIGTPIDDVLLLCYHYDPATGKYGAAVLGLVRAGGVATMLAFAVFLTVSLRRDRAEARAAAASRT